MRLLHRIVGRLRSIVRKRHLDAELDEELRFILERQIEENVVRGMTPETARFTALREVGGIEQIKEECRDMRRTAWFEVLLQDIRFAIRTFRRRPAFTGSVLAILALGVGSSTAIFSVVNRVLLTALPYRAPESLVRVFGVWEHGSREGISPPDFLDYRRHSTSFEAIAAASNTTPLLNLKAAGDPEQVRSRNVTAGFFSTLGIQPLAGREFRPADEVWKGRPVAILSHGLWQRQYGGSSSVVGQTLAINGTLYTIVGVLPPFFNFLGSTDLFTPVQYNPAPVFRSIRRLIMIGRLKPGVDLRHAQAELDLTAGRLQEQYRQFDNGWSTRVAPLTDEVVKDVRPGLLLLLGAIGLVMLLVSASIASLMLSHAASRQAELSIRIALGASRGRVGRQLLTECLFLAVAGGAIGCGICYWGIQLIKRYGPATIPRLAEVGIDFNVLVFNLAVSVIVGLFFGLQPALAAGRMELSEVLKAGGRTITRRLGVRDLLVMAQVTISVILLVGAGLMLRSLVLLEHINPGFQPANILTTRIALPASKYGGITGTKAAAFFHDAIQRIEAIPGVESVALTSELPLSGMNNPTPRMAKSVEGKPSFLYLRSVSPAYRDVMRIPLLAGRFLTAEDRRNMPRVVVISEQLRKDVFGNQNPIGQRLDFDFEDYQAVVVGVVGDVRHTSLASPPFREAYLPLDQSTLLNYDVIARTKIDPKSIGGALRTAIWSLDSDESIGALRTVEEVVDLGLTQPKFRGYLLGGFAAMALILSAAGLYGLLNFMVSQRRREIGIRIALGAPASAVVASALARGVGLTVAGLCLGLGAAFGLTRYMSTLVYGIGLADPRTFAAGAAILLLVAFLASYLPARRAVQVDPVEALRTE